MVSSFIKLIFLLGLVDLLTSEPQGPPQNNLMARIRTRISDGPAQPPGEGEGERPGEGPSPPGEGPSPPFGQSLGDRCPFPPNEDGDWPDFCFDVIGENCECFFDDIVVRQEECVRENMTLYEELVHLQMQLERERDLKRHELGLGSRPEAYQHVLECLRVAEEIV